MFHVHNDYVRQRPQHFRVRKRVADQQNSGAITKRLERLFLQLFIHTGERFMEFENVSSQESGRSIVIDFQTMNIHTGLYVRKPREEANLIIGRGNTES